MSLSVLSVNTALNLSLGLYYLYMKIRLFNNLSYLTSTYGTTTLADSETKSKI